MTRFTLFLTLAASLLFGPGCGTLSNKGAIDIAPPGDQPMPRNDPFGGVKTDAMGVGIGLVGTVGLAFGLVDLPLSLVGDLATLPATLGSDSPEADASEQNECKKDTLLAIYKIQKAGNGNKNEEKEKIKNILSSISTRFDFKRSTPDQILLCLKNEDFSLRLEEDTRNRGVFVLRFTARPDPSGSDAAEKLRRDLEQRLENEFGDRFLKIR